MSCSFRNCCQCYKFEFSPNGAKGFQVKYEENNNQVTQFFLYSSLRWWRMDYLFEDKLWAVLIYLDQGIKFTYLFKCQGDAERVYNDLVAAAAQ